MLCDDLCCSGYATEVNLISRLDLLDTYRLLEPRSVLGRTDELRPLVFELLVASARLV